MGLSSADAARAVAEFQDGMNQRFQYFRQMTAPLDSMEASPEREALTLSVIQFLSATEQLISGFAERADSLGRAGFPQLAGSIASATQDIQTAKQEYLEMYQNTVETLRQVNKIWSQAQREVVSDASMPEVP